MTADQLFQIVNPLALAGWLVLIAAVILRKQAWLRGVAGRIWPLGLSLLYVVLIAFFFSQAPGGFDTLDNVQLLFTSDWAALAGWVHYLAFDLFVGSWIAGRMLDESLPRWPLIVLLPLTFLFGPAGLVGYEVTRLMLQPKSEVVS